MGESQQFKAASTEEQQSTLTIEGVLKEISQYRNNTTKANSAIPDKVWEKILHLGEKHSPLKIGCLFDITPAQYSNKVKQLRPKKKPEQRPVSIELCEVKTKKPVYQPLEIPARQTIIVEFRRPDGQLMKLHTTTDNFRTVMSLFFERGCDASDHLKT